MCSTSLRFGTARRVRAVGGRCVIGPDETRLVVTTCGVKLHVIGEEAYISLYT